MFVIALKKTPNKCVSFNNEKKSCSFLIGHLERKDGVHVQALFRGKLTSVEEHVSDEGTASVDPERVAAEHDSFGDDPVRVDGQN